MAEATKLTSQATATRVPQFGVEQPIIDPYKNMVATLNKFVDQNNDQMDADARMEARKAGALAGLNSDFQTMRGNTIYATEYNKAAEDVYLNRTLLSTQKDMDDLYQRFINDPDQLQEKGSSLAAALSAHVPDEYKPQFITHFSNNLSSYVSKARGNLVQLQKDEHKASFEDAEFVLSNKIMDAAKNGDHQLANANLSLYIEQLNRNGPSGTRALTNEEIHSKQRVVMRGYEKSVIGGEFERAPDKVGFIRSLSNRDNFKTLYSPDEQKQIVEGLYSSLSQQMSVQNQMEAQRTKELKKTMSALTIDVINNPTDTVKLEKARKYATAYGLEDELVKVNKIVSSDGAEDDAATVRELFGAAYRGGVVKLPDGTERVVSVDEVVGKIGNGLKKETATQIINILEKNNSGGDEHFTTWGDYKQAQQRIDDAFPVKTDLMGRVLEQDIENERARAELKSSLYDQMEANYKEWSQEGRKYNAKPDARQKSNLMIKNKLDDISGKKKLLDSVPMQYRNIKSINKAVQEKKITTAQANAYIKALAEAGIVKERQ